MSKRLVGAIAALVRVRHLLPTESLSLLYHAFFGSFLAFDIEAFGFNNAKFLRPVQLLQKRAVRIIAKAGPRNHTSPIFSSSRIVPYLSLIKYDVCPLIHNIFTDGARNIVNIKLSSDPTRGGSSNLCIPIRSKSRVTRSSIASEGTATWNALPQDIGGSKLSSYQYFQQTSFDAFHRKRILPMVYSTHTSSQLCITV